MHLLVATDKQQWEMRLTLHAGVRATIVAIQRKPTDLRRGKVRPAGASLFHWVGP